MSPNEAPAPEMSALEDGQLVARAGAGDRDAFAVLVRRHQRFVLSLAYRLLGDLHEAEDAAQEVFLRLWRAAARYRPEAALEAYLRTLTVNLCLDWTRKPGLLVLAPEIEAAAKGDPHGELAAEERRRALFRALQTLPAPQRAAVVLFHMEGLPVKAIAAQLETSPKAVESLLSRARIGLRERMVPR